MRIINNHSMRIGLLLLIGLWSSSSTAQERLPLTNWFQTGPASQGSWILADDQLSVTQELDATDGISFFVSDESYQNFEATFSLAVNTASDDDHIGIVLGYNNPLDSSEGTTISANFVLLDWKQTFQNFSGNVAEEGLALSRYLGTFETSSASNNSEWAFWTHNPALPGYALLDDLFGGGTGWEDFITYQLRVRYTENRITIDLQGGSGAFEERIRILDASGEFPEGRIGFYTYSQQDVTFSVTEPRTINTEIPNRYSTNALGGRWSAAGNLTNFGLAGQLANETQVTGGNYSGTVGFVAPVSISEENLPPVAESLNLEILYNEGEQIELTGFDPEGQAISYELLETPENGTLVPLNGNENGSFYTFEPDNLLVFDSLYRDTIVFRVREVATGLASAPGFIPFSFIVQDAPMDISSLSFELGSGALELAWLDSTINQSYSLEVFYFDLTDPLAPDYRPLVNNSFSISDLTISGDTVKHGFSASPDEHPYLFGENNRVFITTAVSSPSGQGDFDGFIIDNQLGGRVSASEDGFFFAFGGTSRVPENQTVDLKLMGVELGEFSLASSSVEVLTDPTAGTINQPELSRSVSALNIWDLEYTATKEVGGLDSIQFRVYSGERETYDTAYARIIVTDVNDAPRIGKLNRRRIMEDTMLEFPIDIQDPDNEVQVVVESNRVNDVTALYDNGIIILTPAENFFGEASINIFVSEIGTAENYTAFERFELEVEPVNDQPVVRAIANQTVLEDTPLNLVVSASDPDGPAILDLTSTVSNPVLASTEVEESLLTITPSTNANGTFEISIQADDRTGSDNAQSEPVSFTVEITPVNDAPGIVQPIPVQTLVSGFPNYVLNLGAFFSDVETNTADLSFDIQGNDQISVTVTDGIATVSAPTTFSGTETVSITASDGELEVSQSVTFVVQQSSPNILISQPLNTLALDEDFGSASIDLSNVFTDQNNANASFNFTVAGNSSLMASVTGSNLTINSAKDFFGTESLVIVGTSNGQANFTTFDVVVNPVNDAPVLGAIANQSILEDNDLKSLPLLVSDVDNEVAALSFEVSSSNRSVVNSSGLFIRGNESYSLDISPLENANGRTTISVVVTDGEQSDSIAFEVIVQGLNDAPQFSATAIGNAIEDELFTLNVNELFSDPDGDTLQLSVDVLPNWLSFDGQDLSGTPLNGDVGIVSIDISATDQAGLSATELVNFEVENTNDAPVLAFDVADRVTLQDSEFNFSIPINAVTDIDAGDIITYSFESFPSWASAQGNLLTGTPSVSDAEQEYEVIFRGTDLAGLFIQDTFLIEVASTPYDVTIEVPSQVEVCAGETVTITASGAFTYNWFDETNNQVATATDTYTFTPSESSTIFVEGQNEIGRVTAERFSIVVIVNPLPEALISAGSPATEQELTANEVNGASYQWFLNGSPINGATQRTFLADTEGIYTVQVTTAAGCSSLSEPFEVDLVLGLFDLDTEISIYPNPVFENLYIQGTSLPTTLKVRLFHVGGAEQNVQINLMGNRMVMDLSELITGMYILLIEDDDQVRRINIFKK
jgi:hypothetical protein